MSVRHLDYTGITKSTVLQYECVAPAIHSGLVRPVWNLVSPKPVRLAYIDASYLIGCEPTWVKLTGAGRRIRNVG